MRGKVRSVGRVELRRENGGVLHFATRYEDREVVEMRKRVLRRVEDELVEDERDR